MSYNPLFSLISQIISHIHGIGRLDASRPGVVVLRRGRSSGAPETGQLQKKKHPWCLVASERETGTRTLIRYYAKRWGIETSFRDIKDMRFGTGLSAMRVSTRSVETGCYCSVRWRLDC